MPIDLAASGDGPTVGTALLCAIGLVLEKMSIPVRIQNMEQERCGSSTYRGSRWR